MSRIPEDESTTERRSALRPTLQGRSRDHLSSWRTVTRRLSWRIWQPSVEIARKRGLYVKSSSGAVFWFVIVRGRNGDLRRSRRRFPLGGRGRSPEFLVDVTPVKTLPYPWPLSGVQARLCGLAWWSAKTGDFSIRISTHESNLTNPATLPIQTPSRSRNHG